MSRLHDAIREALQHYHCAHWQQDEDNGGLPLPDALTPPWGDGTVRMGMEEIDLITDEVAAAVESLAAPADEWMKEMDRLLNLYSLDLGDWVGAKCAGDWSVNIEAHKQAANEAREALLAHARQRVQPASEEQPARQGEHNGGDYDMRHQVHLVRGDAGRPDGSEGREACWMARNGYSCACVICSADPAPIPSAAPDCLAGAGKEMPPEGTSND